MGFDADIRHMGDSVGNYVKIIRPDRGSAAEKKKFFFCVFFSNSSNMTSNFLDFISKSLCFCQFFDDLLLLNFVSKE
jgi:hypothetical protein